MKVTRRELNLLIESYLSEDTINERLKAIDSTAYEIPRCDFRFDPKFLGFYEFMKTGQAPRGGVFDDSDKPMFFNPAFRNALENEILPFMNLMAVPTFGIKAKCNALKSMQDSFNEIYLQFTSGFKGSGIGSKPDPDNKNKEKEKFEKGIKDLYLKIFRNLDKIMLAKNIKLTESRVSGIITSSSSLTSGITRQELTYASFLLGDLTKARTDYRYEVASIVKNFSSKGDSAKSVNDLMKLSAPSSSIPGYDKNGIRALFTAITDEMDPTSGSGYLGEITNRLFDKLRKNGII